MNKIVALFLIGLGVYVGYCGVHATMYALNIYLALMPVAISAWLMFLGLFILAKA